MVQMKAPKSLASQAGLKRSHVKIESRLYCQRQKQQQQQQEDTRSRGGGSDIKSQSSLAASPTTTTTMPNYMKPTNSSNARKEKENLQVTTTIHSRPAATDKKKCSRNTRDSALNNKQQYYYSSKATCSSTMKDSKFPKALDLIAGGTEAQGSSLTKVCPYAYCSLNGHHHQPPLPPLKRFVSARRKSLKTQKSMELDQVKGAGKDKKKETASDDFFFFVVDIYSSMQQNEQTEIAIKTEDETETPDVLRYEDDDDDADADQNSEPSDEEDMYEKNLLEYVECCDQRVEEELHVRGKISKEEEEEDEVEESERVPTVEEVENSLPDNRSECSEHSDEGFGLPTPYCEDEEEAPEDDVVAASSPSGAFSLDTIADNAYATYDADAELQREVEDEVAERIDAMGLHDGSGNEGGDLCQSSKGDHDLHRNWGIVHSVFESSKEAVSEEPEEDAETENTLDGPEVQVLVVDQSIEEGDGTSPSPVAQHSDSCDNFTEPEQAAAEGDHIQTKPEMQDFICNGEVEDTSNTPDVQNCEETKARMRIVRKKMTTEEQRDETKEFNPRGPRFLAVEPDPEAEKVDLRHQTMDEKKNSEEWMVDYALRQALMKLAPAPKRKVSLLVQAFESVTPLHDWENATSGFGHARIIQACN